MPRPSARPLIGRYWIQFPFASHGRCRNCHSHEGGNPALGSEDCKDFRSLGNDGLG